MTKPWWATANNALPFTHDEAVEAAAREGYAVRCNTNGPRTLQHYASRDIMARQSADAKIIIETYLAIRGTP